MAFPQRLLQSLVMNSSSGPEISWKSLDKDCRIRAEGGVVASASRLS